MTENSRRLPAYEHFLMSAAEPTDGEMRATFPGWEVWKGICGLWYARRLLSNPPVVVRGEDLTDLRDQIRDEEGRRQWM
jgi:hypothetical protein